MFLCEEFHFIDCHVVDFIPYQNTKETCQNMKNLSISLFYYSYLVFMCAVRHILMS